MNTNEFIALFFLIMTIAVAIIAGVVCETTLAKTLCGIGAFISFCFAAFFNQKGINKK